MRQIKDLEHVSRTGVRETCSRPVCVERCRANQAGLVSNSYAFSSHLELVQQRRPARLGPAKENGVGDVIFLGVGIVSFALLALYVFGCGKA
jgi:hypothetical protein